MYCDNQFCTPVLDCHNLVCTPNIMFSIFQGFLNKNPADRLGCNRESGFVEIMTHAFFKTIDWALLEQKQIPPPYR